MNLGKSIKSFPDTMIRDIVSHKVFYLVDNYTDSFVWEFIRHTLNEPVNRILTINLNINK